MKFCFCRQILQNYWQRLLNNRNKYHETITTIKDPNNNNQVTNGIRDQSRIPHIPNGHFASVGTKLASKLPTKKQSYGLSQEIKITWSFFFFQTDSQDDVKQEILSLPNNQSYGLYSCPTQLLKCSCDIYLLSFRTFSILLLRMVYTHQNLRSPKPHLSITP